MNICVLSDKYPPHNAGGAGVIAANLAEAYETAGHDVTVVTAVENPEDAGHRQRNGVMVQASHVRTFNPLRPYYSIYNPFAASEVATVLDEHSFDVVHAHNLHQCLSYHSITLAKRRDIPVVLTVHDAMSVEYGKLVPDPKQIDCSDGAVRDSLEAGKLSEPAASPYKVDPWEQLKRRKIFYFPLRNRLNRRYLNDRVDVTVAVSNALKRGLSVNGVYPDSVIHNGTETSGYDGVDAVRFRDAAGLDNERVVLFSSRPEYYKGGEQLARAFRRVAATQKDVVLAVTGSETAFLERMQELASPYDDRVVTTGWVDEGTLRSGYEAASLVVTPSLYLDPFPTVNLEALAAQTPVIATCFGGSKEIVIDGSTGVITNPYNIESLTLSINELLNNPERRKRYGENGRARVERLFSLEDQVDQYLNLFDQVTDHSDRR
jgi:glycosyltransferase involved in cell wall biosynthesis